MISLGSPRIEREEVKAVSQLLSRGELSLGQTVEEFESEFADFVDRNHAACLCSGSVALELAIEVSPLEEGDAVIISPFNCGAILYTLLRTGLSPVFCDINIETFNIDPASVKSRLLSSEQEIDGLLLTHLYGQPSDMDSLTALAGHHDLTVINDFAQCPGATYDGQDVATFGDIGVCSFGATKNITTAEGGVVVSDDASHTSLVKKLRSNTADDPHNPLRSVRMNDIEAAIGLQQLEKYEKILDIKRTVAGKYRAELEGDLSLSVVEDDRTHVYHGFPVRTNQNDELQQYLSEKEIETAVVYDQPLYEYTLAPETNREQFPATERASQEVLLLPIHSNLGDDEVERVVRAVNSFFKSK